MLGRKLFQFLSPEELQTFFETPPDIHEDCLPHTVVAGKHSPSRQHGEDACAPSHAAAAALPLAARAGASSCELLPPALTQAGACSEEWEMFWKWEQSLESRRYKGGGAAETRTKSFSIHYWFHFQC